MVSIGTAAVQVAATLRVVPTLLLPLEWPVAETVTVVVSSPAVCPDFALTVMTIAELVAPDAIVVDVTPSVEVLKLVVLLSEELSV
jgi:hypothetical protein